MVTPAVCYATLLFLVFGLFVPSPSHAGEIAPPAKPKVFERAFKVTDFGAVADGTTLCTDAIAKAIDAAKQAGGGTVIFPAGGKYLSGPFVLCDNLTIRIETGATLVAINNLDTFPKKAAGEGSYAERGEYEDFILAESKHDIVFTGGGTIDGQGQPWWDKYRKRGDVDPRLTLPRRPDLIVLNKCERVLFDGVTLTNSPMFHLVPRDCVDVTVTNSQFIAPEDAPNADGIDPSGLRYSITNCLFDTGDDCIAVKPQRARTDGHLSCEDFLIENCQFKAGHGLSIGGQTPGGLRRMTVRNCTFDGTDAGIRMKANRGSGGLVEDLLYENLTMKNVKVAVQITSYYPKVPADLAGDPAQDLNATTPIWRNIVIRNVTAVDSGEAGQLFGLAEKSIESVTFDNVNIAAKKPMRIVRANGIKFMNSTVTTPKGTAIETHDATVEGHETSPMK
jgi:polygalacturonase